ncbi:MAG: HD domain-containing protein [Piscinibacter sp.]|nr:HD domain-containing protein [Piscinibacter sp.]
MGEASSTVESAPEGAAFLQAVTEMARRRPIVTSRAIYNANGLKLLEGGVTVDGSLYDRLVRHRLSSPLDECLDSEPGVDGKVLRAAIECLIDPVGLFAATAPAGRVRRMMLEAVEAIPLPRPVAFQLTLLRANRPDLFDHSLRSALLCAHLVGEAGAPLHDITMAAAAGLLHDLGMLHIDPALLAPGQLLSGDERRPLYVHPLTGSMLIQRFHAYPREVARAVLEHHERLDGSGYPRGLVGDALSPLGRVLSLAELVTAMFDGRRRHPEQRVSLALRMNPRRYDPVLVRSIQRLLRTLPPPADASTVLVEEALHRLRLLSEHALQWHGTLEPLVAESEGDRRAVLLSVDEQVQSLQRMLYNAGVTPDQLERLGQDDTRDPAVRIELWALEQELQWHLRATANQLERRWRNAAAATPLPASLAEWLAQVRAIDQVG